MFQEIIEKTTGPDQVISGGFILSFTWKHVDIFAMELSLFITFMMG